MCLMQMEGAERVVEGEVIDIPGLKNIVHVSSGYRVIVSNRPGIWGDPFIDAKEIRPGVFDVSGYRYFRLAVR